MDLVFNDFFCSVLARDMQFPRDNFCFVLKILCRFRSWSLVCVYSHEVKDVFRLLLIYRAFVLDTEGKTVLISGLFPEGSVKVSAHLPDSVPCTQDPTFSYQAL